MDLQTKLRKVIKMDLQKLLKPQKIALIGASEKDTLGGIALQMMMKNAKERLVDLYLVNPKRDQIYDLPCYHSISNIPCNIDMVIIATPKSSVEALLEEAATKGAKGAVVYASGYSETGKKEDQEAEIRLKALCEKLDIALMGPNCAGFINFRDNVHAMGFFTTIRDREGSVGLISQSGMICTLLLDSGKVDFSHVISCGNSKVVEVVDYMDFLVDDPNTKIIAAYIEGISNAEKFVKVLKKAAQKKKPVVLLKVGKSEAGSRSAASHTGSLSGSDKAFDAIFKKYGVIRVDDLEDLLGICNLFSTLDILPKSNRIVSVNGSGGETGVSCDMGHFYELNFPDFSQEVFQKLKLRLPSYATINNPLDTTATVCYDSQVFADIMEDILDDSNFDLALVGISIVEELTDTCVQHMSEGLAILGKNGKLKKPVIVVPAIESGRMKLYSEMLKDAGIPVTAPCYYGYKHVKMLLDYCQWADNVDMEKLADAVPNMKEGVSIALSEHESKLLLAKYGVPIPEEYIATSATQAMELCDKIGYPVVLKIESADILHKSDLGGVMLGIKDKEEVKMAYEAIMAKCTAAKPNAKINGVLIQKMLEKGIEIIIGVNNDPLFGPMIMVGLGGVFVEIFKDVQLFPAPLTKEDARSMLNSLKSSKLFYGYRGEKELDVEAVLDVLLAVSAFAVAHKDSLVEADINPLFVYEKGKGVAVADGLIVMKQSQKNA